MKTDANCDDGAVERSATISLGNDLGEGAGQKASLSYKGFFERTPYLWRKDSTARPTAPPPSEMSVLRHGWRSETDTGPRSSPSFFGGPSKMAGRIYMTVT